MTLERATSDSGPVFEPGDQVMVPAEVAKSYVVAGRRLYVLELGLERGARVRVTVGGDVPVEARAVGAGENHLPLASKRWDSLAAAAEVDTVCLMPETIALYEPGLIVLNTRTGELVCVLAVSDVAIMVRRGVGSGPVPMRRGDEMVIVGREGSA